MCLGKEESSHKNEQRFNENHLEISIHVSKRLRGGYPGIEKSEPKGCCGLTTQKRWLHDQWPLVLELVVKKDKQVFPVLRIWTVEKENVNLKLSERDLPLWTTWRNNSASQRDATYQEPIVKPSMPAGKCTISVGRIQVEDEGRQGGMWKNSKNPRGKHAQ